EAEAVSDGLSWAEHTDGHLLDDVLLNPSRERLARHADGTERYAIELRLPDVGREGEPDLEGRLRREVVEAERGEEADDALGDALRHDGEVVVLADLAVWQ